MKLAPLAFTGDGESTGFFRGDQVHRRLSGAECTRR
jgi:hypothetical protein